MTLMIGDRVKLNPRNFQTFTPEQRAMRGTVVVVERPSKAPVGAFQGQYGVKVQWDGSTVPALIFSGALEQE